MAASDVLLIGALIFMFGIGLFVIHFIGSTMVDTLSTTTEWNQSEDAMTALDSVTTISTRLDYVGFVIFIGLVLGLIITGWFIGGMPIFMFIYFIVVVISVVLSTVMSHVWDTVTQAGVFGTTINAFPILNHIISNGALYMSIVGFLGLVAMFAKPYTQ